MSIEARRYSTVRISDRNKLPSLEKVGKLGTPLGKLSIVTHSDCKSAASWLRRFESFLPHHPEKTVDQGSENISASLFGEVNPTGFV
jgi:hypothetical protein